MVAVAGVSLNECPSVGAMFARGFDFTLIAIVFTFVEGY